MAQTKKARTAAKAPETKAQEHAYIKPGIEDNFLVRMGRPIRQEAQAAMDKIYGGRPKPPEGQWLAYLISLGTETALAQHAQGATTAP